MATSTMTHLSKPVVLAYIAVLLSACAPVGYIKPGMTEEEVTRELSECAEIARHQAFRDIPTMDFRFGALHSRLHHRDRLSACAARRSRSGMIPDLDIYRSANLLVKQHGEDAPIHAAMRADAMLDKGDLGGYAAWKRIVRAIEELQGTDPKPDEAIH